MLTATGQRMKISKGGTAEFVAKRDLPRNTDTHPLYRHSGVFFTENE